jgi:iron complex outermembrane recepter protein
VKSPNRVSVLNVAASVMAIVAAASAARAAAPASTTAVTAESTQLEEVVVTAQFRSQNLQDTPIAITAVNAAMLEARGQDSIAQIAAQAPNVSLRPQPQNGGNGLIAFIRGVGQTDFNYAVDPGVGIYVDDVYIPTLSSSLMDLMDLDRVEILRGPQGTLAGKNSIGGAIKLFSAKPQGDDSGSLKLSYGSLNEVDVRGMADLKITDDLALRITGMSKSHDGYVGDLDYSQTHPGSNVPGNNSRGNGNSDYTTMGGINHTAGRAALRWTPTDALEVNVSADYTRERDEAIPVILLAAGAIPTAASPVFNPFSTGASSSLSSFPPPTYGNPWLVGKNGQPVNMSCAFVPAGKYSCDPANRNLKGWDPRFVSYSSFMDAMQPTAQAPYKPYFAIPETLFTGSGVMANVSYHLNDNMSLVYIGSYREYNSKFGQDQDATPLPESQLDNELNHHAFTSELRFNFKTSENFLEGTLGAFYLKQQGTYTARVDLNYVFATIDFLHGPDTTPSETKAIFGTATIHPTEKLSLTGGLRYTKDQKDYTYFRSNPDGTIPNAAPGGCGLFTQPNCLLAGIYDITGSFKGDNTDWRAVVDYKFTDDFMAYVSGSTGFKGGGVNPRPFFITQKLPFNPETLTTYEAGFKSDLFDRHMRLNGAVFFNTYKDIQLSKQRCPESAPFPSTPCLRPDNIGAADVKGAELEASIYPVEGLSFDASVSWLDFKYTSDVDPATGNLVNTSIPPTAITPYTPELTYSVGGQYDYHSDVGTFTARLDGSYRGEIFTTGENGPWSKMDSLFLANARLSWANQDNAWKVSLEVQNLFDEYYFQSISDITSSLGLQTGSPGLPRTYLLSVERKFN